MRLAITLHRMSPSASCPGVGVLKFEVFRGSITWPVVPVYASYLTLRSCSQDSKPVWLARHSTVPLFHPLDLAGRGAVYIVFPQVVVATALKDHGAYAPALGAATRHPQRGTDWYTDVRVR